MKLSKWNLIACIVLVLSSVLSFGVIVAADEQPEPGTPRDNACYAGGVMEGKCDSEWAWKGGWYLARFLSGDLTREQVPDEFQILLPPPVDTTSNALTICKDVIGSFLADVTACASSNQTGSTELLTGGFYEYYVFTSDATGASCPTTFNGVTLSGTGIATSMWASVFGFSPAEISQLGLGDFFCYYTIT